MPSSERGSEHLIQPGTPGPEAEEPLPEPVFVDESGLRGRLLRGLGWPVSVVGAVLAVAMGGSLIGVQADAPAMEIPAQPAPAAAASAAPSPSPSASPSASASSSGTPTRSTSPRPGSSAGTTKPSTGTHGATPSGKSTKHP
ncbi:hypothetical protein [Kitasatospora sp. CB02891]|uniref:hypothetical protein n=1 Tax=Kitasatospora sp. CB02891 TaxID=2020329 RepID=UPI0012FDBE3A|nr:hypothetical protein [Kitasatospora sp. CB02891]